jgi:hypothetical protein
LSKVNFIDNNETSLCVIAKRIHKIYPNAKIILVIRRKKDWLKSLYNHYCRVKTRNNIDSFEKWKKNVFDEEDLEFEKYIDCLEKLFSSVLVLHYEDLRDDPDKFIAKICDFIGVKTPDYTIEQTNRTPSQNAIKIINKLNRLSKKKGVPKFIRIGFEEIVQKIS